MSLKGNLQSVDLANVLQMLSINQKEGTLVLFDGETRKSIYFSRDGVSMLSRGRRGTDSLGRVLLRYGKLTAEQLAESLQKQRDEGKRLGQVLQEMNLVTSDDIENAIRTQIEEEIYNLFIWKEASFEFLEGPPPPSQEEQPTRVTFNVNSLILEAQRRADEWNWIRGLVPSLDEIYHPTEKLAEAEVDDDVFHFPFAPRVLESLQQGRLNVGEIIEASCAAKFEVCKILAILLEQDAIRPLQLSELQVLAQEASGRGDHRQAAKFYSRIVELGGATPHVNLALGYALEAMEEPERASMFLRAAAESYVEGLEPKPAFDAYLRIARSLPTDLSAVARIVEIACEHPEILQSNKHEVVETGRRLAFCLKELGRLPAALQVLTRIVQADPSDLALRTLLVTVYQESGMQAEAVAELESMAATCAARQNYDEAIRALRKVLAIDRNRDGVVKKIEQYTRARDSGKRMARRLVVSGAAVAIVAAGAFGWYQYKEGSRRKFDELNRFADEKLTPGREKYAEAKGRLEVALEKLKAWETAEPAEVMGQAQEARLCLDQMGKALANNERIARAIYDENQSDFPSPSWPTDLLKAHVASHNELKEKFARLSTAATAGAGVRATEGKTLLAKGRIYSSIPLFERAALLMEAFKAPDPDIERARADLEIARSYPRKFEEAQAAFDKEWSTGDRPGATSRLVQFLLGYGLPADLIERARFRVHVRTVPKGATIRPRTGPMKGREIAAGADGAEIEFTLAEGLDAEVAYGGFRSGQLAAPPTREGAELPPILERYPVERTVVLDKVPLWSVPCGSGGLDGLPAEVPGADAVVVAARDGSIHRISLADGATTSCDTGTASGFGAGAAATRDAAFAASLDGLVVAVDLATMKPRWRVERKDGPGPVRGRPVIVNGVLVVAGDGGTVIGYDTTSPAARELWRVALPRGGGTRLPLVAAGDRVLVLCGDGVVRSVGPVTGPASFFEIHPSGQLEAQYAAPRGEPLLPGTGRLVFGQEPTSRAGAFVLIQFPPTGTAGSPWFGSRWTCSEPEADPVGACVLGEDLILLFSNGNCRRFGLRSDPNSGSELVSISVAKDGPTGAPVVSGDVLYIATRKGLSAVRLSAKGYDVLWRWASAKDVELSTPPFLVGNRILVGGRDGILHALQRE